MDGIELDESELVLEDEEDGVVAIAARGMHREGSGLVDDDNVIVAVNDPNGRIGDGRLVAVDEMHQLV